MSLPVITAITNFILKNMNNRVKLANWMADTKKDYHQGLILFRELEINSEMLPFLRTGKPGKLHRSLLIRQIETYARINQIRPTPAKEIPAPVVNPHPVIPEVVRSTEVKATVPSPVMERPKVDKNPVVRYEDLPVELQVLFDENGRFNNETKAFHARLKTLKDSTASGAREERARLAGEILWRKDKMRSNWDRIDGWWKNRNVQEDPIEKAKREALEKEKRIRANLNYIRRYYGNEKNRDEVMLRMRELDKWNISYEKLLRNI